MIMMTPLPSLRDTHPSRGGQGGQLLILPRALILTLSVVEGEGSRYTHGGNCFQPISTKFQKILANFTALWYTEVATQFHIFYADGYTGI